MSENIQTANIGYTSSCLRQKINKTIYLTETCFNEKSTQNIEDKLERVILLDLEHGKQGKTRKSDEK